MKALLCSEAVEREYETGPASEMCKAYILSPSGLDKPLMPTFGGLAPQCVHVPKNIRS